LAQLRKSLRKPSTKLQSYKSGDKLRQKDNPVG